MDNSVLIEKLNPIVEDAFDWNWLSEDAPYDLQQSYQSAILDAISALKASDERIAELEGAIEAFLTDNVMGPEHQSVNWVRSFTETITKTETQKPAAGKQDGLG